MCEELNLVIKFVSRMCFARSDVLVLGIRISNGNWDDNALLAGDRMEEPKAPMV